MNLTPRSDHGFSLVEAICAVVILSVGLLGVVEALTLALRYSRDQERHNTAVLLAASRLEEFRAEAYVSEGDADGDFAPDFPDWTWTQTVSPTALDGLFDVVVSVSRSEQEEPLFTLETQLFNTPLEDPSDIEERDSRRRSERP